jgi:hypothetical protein
MQAFGNLLLRRVQAEDALTREKIAEWFNEISFVLYEMAQCTDGRGLEIDDKTRRCKTRDYLQIEPKDVYIDEAVDEKLKTADSWANGDSVLVDGAEYARLPVYIV